MAPYIKDKKSNHDGKLEPEIILGAFVLVFVFCVIVAFLLNSLLKTPTPKEVSWTGTATQKTTRTTELLQLQLSKEQVESSSFEGRTESSALGNVGYVQGSSEGRPVTYIYIRYRAENGDIIDRLIPRDNVRLRDDLAPGAPATVEIEVVKKREASYEDIQKDPSLAHNIRREPFDDSLPPEKCGEHPDDTPDEWRLDSETPAVVHVPKNSVIVTINPNMVPDGAKKE